MSQNATSRPFWEVKSLAEMSAQEWESLCDGCGRCCLVRLEDEDTGAIAETNIACRLLETATCRCSDYANRFARVPDCAKIDAKSVYKMTWLPSSCAYRRLAEGKGLDDWHPLVSGCTDSVIEAGVSVAGWTISEDYVDPDELEAHILGIESGD